MPGKRPRQIQRTTSLLQLGGSGTAMGARFSRTAPESFYGDAGVPQNGLSAPLKEDLLETMEFCTGAEESVPMDGNSNCMAVDGSKEESSFASPAVRPGVLHEATRPSFQNPRHHSLHPSYFVHPHYSRPTFTQAGFPRSQESDRSAQAIHFLDVCFRCSKRLGHGRDVFIYRGDRAFCSVECRHSQIVADERREKCGTAAAKEGSSNATSNNPNSSNQVETAAAA